VKEAVLHGNNFELVVRYRNRFGRDVKYSSGFEGVIPYIERKFTRPKASGANSGSRLLARNRVSHLSGHALKPEILAVTVKELSISELANKSLTDAHASWNRSPWVSATTQLLHPFLREIQARLEFLLEVGLNYLTLSRSAGRSRAVKHSAFVGHPNWFWADRGALCSWMNRAWAAPKR
jgi:excinuclease ABC subunit A